MKRTYLVTIAVLIVAQGRAQAFITDDAILAMHYAEDKTFHAFMQVQIIQEIATLKQNYDASVRYYNEWKQLNSGKGIFQNIAAQVKTAQQQEDRSIQQQIDSTFIHTYNTNTDEDKLYQALDQSVVSNIRYAGDELANVIANQKTGQQIAANADGLSPKDAANLSAKTQGIQVQMLTQIHEDNLRLIQLSSMQLSAQTRERQGQAQAIDSMRQSLQKRYPSANLGQEEAQ